MASPTHQVRVRKLTRSWVELELRSLQDDVVLLWPTLGLRVLAEKLPELALFCQSMVIALEPGLWR